MKEIYIKPTLDIIIDIPDVPDPMDGDKPGNGDIGIGGNDSEVSGDHENDI